MVEIERKFLVKDTSCISDAYGSSVITQGYLNLDPEKTVRIRVKNSEYLMTVKGKTEGITRTEVEFTIERHIGVELMKLCTQPLITKVRHLITFGGRRWEVDVFHGANEGLVVAEIELESEDEEFTKPEWLGEEVSLDVKYANSNLVTNPYSTWD